MNTSIKQRLCCALVSFLLVAVFIGSLLCALILPFLSSNGVASADSTNGVVENNIILNSSFSDFSNWSVAGASVLSNNPLIFSATSAWGSVYQILPYQELFDKTVTLTVRFRKVSGDSNAVCNLRYRLEGQSSTTGLQSISTASTDYVLRSQTYNLSELINLSYLQVSIYGQTSGTQVEVDFVKLEIGSTFTGYVPKDYENYGYNQGVQDGTIQGYNQYVDNYSITSYLNTDTYISTGGYSVIDGDSTYNILNAQSVENHTRTGTEGVSTIYDSLLAGVNYNLIYTQGSFSSSSTTFNGVSGYYAVSSSLLASNGFNSYINAGTPFSLNNFSSRASIDRTSGLYRFVDLSIAFLDKNGNFIRFDPTQYENANYYLNSNRIFSSSFPTDSIIGDVLSSGQVHYYRLPFDIYGIWIMSYHESGDYYHAYNMKLQFLPNSSYQDGYNAGFIAGEGNVNTQAFYNNGYQQGYENGVIVGAENANNYTFLGVIGAAVDAPINSLFKLLDFDLLGYNMKSFVGALFMLAFIVLIIRLVLGGK